MDLVELRGVVKRFDRRFGAPSAQEHHADRRRRRIDTALDGVDLVVGPGEAVAVLGPRKSGRTTLLSLISGVLRPDEGTVRVRGRATGLVAMNAGFSPSVSVAHNIALNGMLLGLTPAQIEERQATVLDEAGVPASLLPYPLRDLPAPRRSRLGYALALHSDPDVFLADKTVVVGDAAYQEVGLRHIEQLRDSGRAVVVASSNGRIVKRLCQRGVVLRHGEVVYDGRVRRALQRHRELPTE